MTVVYRLVRRERGAEALSGEGARLYGGRWNPPGVPVVYASESRSLAVLEAFVHLTLEARSMRLELCSIELPARVRVTRLDEDRPPRSLDVSQSVGRRWVEEAGTLALVVPSVLVPRESNYVLNAAHPQFGRLALHREPYSFDERLWRR